MLGLPPGPEPKTYTALGQPGFSGAWSPRRAIEPSFWLWCLASGPEKGWRAEPKACAQVAHSVQVCQFTNRGNLCNGINRPLRFLLFIRWKSYETLWIISWDRTEAGLCDGLPHLSSLLWPRGRGLQALLPDVFTDQDNLCAQDCKAEQSCCNGSDRDIVLTVKEMGTSCLGFVSVGDTRYEQQSFLKNGQIRRRMQSWNL